MATGSKKSVTPSAIPEIVKTNVEEVLQSPMADFTIRQLLGLLMSSTGAAERKVYLEDSPEDRPNGFYNRALQLGSIPVDIRVPRTRSGDFRPSSLPTRYQRGYSEEIESILMSLLASSRSINAAKSALKKMGLSSSEQELERVATALMEEMELRNSRPVAPDLIALFADGKYVELREGDKLRPACIYLVVGLGLDGKRHVLCCIAKPGRENLEAWKMIFRGVIERGLRRLMILIHDDFSGLLPITQSLFPTADIQLCTVHMQRNAKAHLSKTDAADFHKRWTSIKSCWDLDVATNQFQQLCDHFVKTYPVWIAELRKKHEHYLAFLKYPEETRRSFSSTNLVEAINGQLEIMRRNSGGYFHSEDTLKLKLGLAVLSLENGKWHRPAKYEQLPQLNAMFHARFESAL
jgi:transposase-like protein